MQSDLANRCPEVNSKEGVLLDTPANASNIAIPF